MKTAHMMTLEQIHADIFVEICEDCGITIISRHSSLNNLARVMTLCERKDLDVAWELFHEKLKKVTTQK